VRGGVLPGNSLSAIESSVSPVQASVRLTTSAGVVDAVLATTPVMRSSVSRVKVSTILLPKVRLTMPL
jgi:hypothetical protein